VVVFDRLGAVAGHVCLVEDEEIVKRGRESDAK